MAPEMIKKNVVSIASDTYALAITMWQLEKRQVPYEGINNEEQIIYGVVKNNLRPTDIFGNYLEGLDKENVLLRKSTRLLIYGRESSDADEFDDVEFSIPTAEGLEWTREDIGYQEPAPINWQEVFSTSQEITVSAAIEFQYQELYKKCWDRKPSRRPPMSNIISELNNLIGSIL